MIRLISVTALTTLAATACGPANVPEAESKGDATWLDENGSPEAIFALGRLADDSPRAKDKLIRRAATDKNVYLAAWQATKRKQPWGGALLRDGLLSPATAEGVAEAMPRKDPDIKDFIPDIEAAMGRLSGPEGAVQGGVLASVGGMAREAIFRRLNDPVSRGAMCSGISSPNATPEAREALFGPSSETRDHAVCIETVVAMATTDDKRLDWISERAEPGLLSAVGRITTFPCARLAPLWTKAFATRPASIYPALTVPLSLAVKRCPKELDSVTAETLLHIPAATGVVINALGPHDGVLFDLKQTCKALPRIASSKVPPILRERASDALAYGCRGVP